MTTETQVQLGFLLTLVGSFGATASAQDPMDRDMTAAVSALIAQRFHIQPQVYELTFPLVVDDSVPLHGAIAVNGVSVPIYSRAKARDKQLAWFIYLSKIEQSGDQVIIKFETPFNATSGTGTMERRDGEWKLVKDQKMRSSSGARIFYGKLYDGVDCRDDTEMARRAMSGSHKDAPAKAKCNAKEFAEVAYARQIKQMLKK